MVAMIDVKDLSYSYPGGAEPTLEGLNFEISKGEIFGFLGPSGSGKSPTQKLLIGLLENYSGSMRAMDREISSWGKDYYRHIGVGFELPNHFSKLSGIENLRLFESFYGVSDSQRSVADLLELVDLTADANKPVAQYSKGMKMRLNFARALLNDPDILFLDEPTAGLDPMTARQLKNTILELKQTGKTVFLTTHNMHDADELCDRVGFIVSGQLKRIGEPQQLKREQGSTKVRLSYRNSEDELVTSEYSLSELATDSEFQACLREPGLESIHSQEATLEEVFIATTGSALQ